MENYRKRYNKKKLNPLVLCSIIVVLCVLFLTLGFSAFQASLEISNISAVIRVQKDIRVTSVNATSSTNGASSNYEEYNVHTITSSVNLPNANSTLTYHIEVTNIGNVEQGIYAIDEIYKNINSNTDSNLEIKSKTVNLKEALCDDTNSTQCKLGSVTTFDITIGYKNNGYDGTNLTHLVELDFDFRRIFNITYNGFTSVSGLPNQMIDGDTKTITFNSTTGIPSNVSVTGATGNYVSPTLTLSNITINNISDNIVISRLYSITYTGFSGNTSGLISNISSSGGTIEFDSTSGIPTQVSVTGATGNYNSSTHILTLSNITGDITITSINGGGSGTPGGTDIIENEDGSTTTITYDENGNPAEATNEITDSSGNTTTQEITYVNGEEVVTGYSIDTSNNSNGGLSVPSEGIDTGVLAFDGNDFEVTLKATFSFANCTATICPIINVTKKNTSVNGVLIYEDRIATSGYGHNSSGTNVNPPYNKFRIGKYVTSAPTGSVDYNIISKITSSQGNGRYGYNSSSSPVTLTIKLYYTSGVFTSEIYDSSGATDVLLAKPYNNTTLAFSDTGTDFDNITIQLGTFESGTTTYPTHDFEIIDFNVTKTVN